jgi:hypothetical protein
MAAHCSIYGCHTDAYPVGPRVKELRAREERAGFNRMERYSTFTKQVKETKRKLLEFLIQAKRKGKSVAGYGLRAKATLSRTSAEFGPTPPQSLQAGEVPAGHAQMAHIRKWRGQFVTPIPQVKVYP